MTDFFDWLKVAGAGEAADKLALQFRLSPEEMRATTDALVPAYILGMQRAMIDPKSWSDLAERFGAMGGFGSTGFLSGPVGELVTRSLFGPDLTAAIARNASLLTGQAPDMLQQMMGPFGALVFGAALQTMAAGAASWPKGYATDPAGQALAETMRRSANAVEAFHRPSGGSAPSAVPGTPAAMMSFFSDAWRTTFPWAPQGPQGGAASPPAFPFDPFGMMGAMTKVFSPPSPAPRPAPADSRQPRRDPVLDLITNAQSMQADYFTSMAALFERKAEPNG
jgi:hypothetical protein